MPLTERGREQAHLAGQAAAGLQLDIIVSSPLIRALETAQIVAGEIGFDPVQIIVNEIFKERSLGNLESHTYDFGSEDDETNLSIETMEHLMQRACKGLELLASFDAENVLLVGHGSFGKALQTVLNPAKRTASRQMPKLCSCYNITFRK